MSSEVGLLDGQVAVVTGGSRGIGRAMATALVEAGAQVAIVARTADDVRSAASAISQASNARVVPVVADVTSTEDVQRMVAETQDRLGPIDLLVNNAGAPGPVGPSWEVDPDEWWAAMEANVKGPFLCSRAVVPSMIGRGTGRIINTSSNSALRSWPFVSGYAVSKAAVTRYGENLADELRDRGVKVFNLAPGFVRTAMTESVAASPGDEKWLDGMMSTNLAEGYDNSADDAGQLAVTLASGQADALSGCWIRITDDIDELLRLRTDEGNADLRKLRLST